MIGAASLGVVLALGVLVVVSSAPTSRRIRLVDRMAPYLGDTATGSTLWIHAGSTPGIAGAARRLIIPALREATVLVDRLVGGSSSVRRRLGGLGGDATVDQFRLEQVIWGCCGLLAGAVAVLAGGFVLGHVMPILAVAAATGGAVAGVLGRDWWLSRAVAKREQAMLAEFPVVADLLALAVVAGEAPPDALRRVCRLTGGELARDLGGALAKAQSGASLTTALGELADRTTLEPFSRFLQGLVVAIERGTPMADVLRAQAADVRELTKRELLEAGGRSEITMLVPVVFLVLPVTVVFALFPGLVTLTSLAR